MDVTIFLFFSKQNKTRNSTSKEPDAPKPTTLITITPWDMSHFSVTEKILLPNDLLLFFECFFNLLQGNNKFSSFLYNKYKYKRSHTTSSSASFLYFCKYVSLNLMFRYRLIKHDLLMFKYSIKGIRYFLFLIPNFTPNGKGKKGQIKTQKRWLPQDLYVVWSRQFRRCQ